MFLEFKCSVKQARAKQTAIAGIPEKNMFIELIEAFKKWGGLFIFAVIMLVIVRIFSSPVEQNVYRAPSLDHPKNDETNQNVEPNEIHALNTVAEELSEKEIQEFEAKIDKLWDNKLAYANFLPSFNSSVGLGDYMKANKLKFSRVEYDCDSDTKTCTVTAWLTQKSNPSKGADTHCGKMAVWKSAEGDLDKWNPVQGLAETIYAYDKKVVFMLIDEENQRWAGCY